jgi:hypothetical protein
MAPARPGFDTGQTQRTRLFPTWTSRTSSAATGLSSRDMVLWRLLVRVQLAPEIVGQVCGCRIRIRIAGAVYNS